MKKVKVLFSVLVVILTTIISDKVKAQILYEHTFHWSYPAEEEPFLTNLGGDDYKWVIVDFYNRPLAKLRNEF